MVVGAFVVVVTVCKFKSGRKVDATEVEQPSSPVEIFATPFQRLGNVLPCE